MGSSDADPEPATRSRSRWTVLAAAVGSLVFASALVSLAAAVLESPVAVSAVAVTTLLAVVLAWRRAATSGDGADAGEESGDGTVWNAIPSWQYDGLHAESGGHTRDRQERALREIQRRADELEGRERE